MSAQGWITLLIVALAAIGLAYKLCPKSKGKSCGGCCGGGGTCHSGQGGSSRSKSPKE